MAARFATGWRQVGTSLTLLSTPPLLGLILDLTGDYDAIFIAFVVLCAATMLIVPAIRLHPRGMPGDENGTAVAAGRAALAAR